MIRLTGSEKIMFLLTVVALGFTIGFIACMCPVATLPRVDFDSHIRVRTPVVRDAEVPEVSLEAHDESEPEEPGR
jgi:hypothetical protein